MADDYTLKIKIDADARQAKKGLDGVGDSLSGIKKIGFAAIAAGITAGVIGIGKAAIDAASDAEETQNKFNVVFSSIKRQATEAAEALADGFGLSSQASQALLSDTGDLLSGFGFTQQAALDMSIQVNELAADLASFTNFSGGAEGASQALTKALLGERESIKSLGIAISEADIAQLAEDKGITGELDRQTKAMLTLELATKQSANAIGDFERSQDSFANQQRIAAAAVQDLQASFGELLIPAATLAVQALTGLVGIVSGLIDGIKFFIGGPVSEFATEAERMGAAIADLRSGFVGAESDIKNLLDITGDYNDEQKLSQDQIVSIAEKYPELATNMDLYNASIGDVVEGLRELRVAEAEVQSTQIVAEIEATTQRAEELSDRLIPVRERIDELKEGLAEGGWNQDQLQAINSELEEQLNTERALLENLGLKEAKIERLKTQQGELQEIIDGTAKAEESATQDSIDSQAELIGAIEKVRQESARLFALEQAGFLARDERLAQGIELYEDAAQSAIDAYQAGDIELAEMITLVNAFNGSAAEMQAILDAMPQPIEESADAVEDLSTGFGVAQGAAMDFYDYIARAEETETEALANAEDKRNKAKLDRLEEEKQARRAALEERMELEEAIAEASSGITMEQAMQIAQNDTMIQNRERLKEIEDEAHAQMLANIEEERQHREAAAQHAEDVMTSAYNEIFGLFNQLVQNSLNNEIAAIDAEEQAALRAAGLITEAETEEERKRNEIKERFRKKRLQAEYDAAVATHLLQGAQLAGEIANSIIVASTIAPPPFNAPAIGAAIALGALQTAAWTASFPKAPSAQFGGEFIVPPGNQQDSGVVRVNSGERVSVESVRSSGGGSGGGSMVVRIGERDFRAYFEEETDRAINSGRVTARRRGFVRS